MSNAVDVVLAFIVAIIQLIPDSPLIYLIALALVLTILNNILWIATGKDLLRK